MRGPFVMGCRNVGALGALAEGVSTTIGARPATAFTRAAALGCIGVFALLAGCGGSKPMPSSQEAQLPAEVRVGETTLRVTTLPTLRLNPAMARQYGVTRDARSVLVVVGLRRGDPANEISIPGTIRAQASDLLGGKQMLALREVSGDGFIDYVGTANVSVPDTLHYEVEARPVDGPALSLQFNRDYFPERAAGQ